MATLLQLAMRENIIPFAPKPMGILGQFAGKKWEEKYNKRKESRDASIT